MEEIVFKRCDVGQAMEDDVHVVVSLDVIETHNTWGNGRMNKWEMATTRNGKMQRRNGE